MNSLDEYLRINKKCYNFLAEEYKNRLELYREIDENIFEPFICKLKSHFNPPVRLLDIGPGAGLNMAMFIREGFFVVGNDVSDKMLSVARITCPKAILVQDNFLDLTIMPESFEGIVARALIHLFPKMEARKVLKKIHSLLVPGGFAFMATTLHKKSREGIFEKENCQSAIKRFRKFWREDEFLEEIKEAGFSLLNKVYHFEEERNKQWINIIASKKNLY